jgi:hypothetical protein
MVANAVLDTLRSHGTGKLLLVERLSALVAPDQVPPCSSVTTESEVNENISSSAGHVSHQ